MKEKIFINGRGGCGKSTILSLIAKKLSENNKVLVIDMDEGNLGLHKILGVEKPKTSLLEYCGGRDRIMGEILKVGIKGMVMQKVGLKDEESSDSIDILDNIHLTELSDEYTTWNGNIGFIEAGKIDNPDEGCACPMGNLTRDFLNHLILEDDEVILVDTSAGIEHIGRGVIESSTQLISIVDPSSDAIMLANKISDLAQKASKQYGVILNKVDNTTKPIILEQLDDGTRILGCVDYSPKIAESNLTQSPIDSIEVNDTIDKICRVI